ncbi:MAG: PAS domain-containing protein [Rhodobacteraceae bacterium]|nr:PAS domain-containing protein [Paracoccaceae bacterium]
MPSSDSPTGAPEKDVAAAPVFPRLQVATLLAGLAEPVLVVDIEDTILIANAAAQDLLGAGCEGQPFYAVLRQPEALAAVEQGLRRRLHAEARLVVDTPGTEITWSIVVAPVSAAETGIDGAVVSFNDISHIEEAEQMRRDFVANVSHELRSPLTALVGFIETLRGAARNDPDARERFLGIMEAEAMRMNRLIADLLSLSRVEANERVRPREVVVMGDVLRTTLAALRPMVEDSGLKVELRHFPQNGAEAPETSLPAPGEGPRVRGDRDQLIQVFHNLVENALKYGGLGGRVTISLRCLPSLPGFTGPAVRVDVIDYGEGIDQIHLPRITERFYRVDSHRSRAMGGTGLGLAIVKHIVNRHRGRLNVESRKGEGSSFSVVLPAA